MTLQRQTNKPPVVVGSRALLRLACLVAALFLSAAGAAPTHAWGTRAEEGWATFYAKRRAGRRTASGERYDPRALVAAHPTLPLGTQVRVTRIETGAAVVVRVIDRGPRDDNV